MAILLLFSTTLKCQQESLRFLQDQHHVPLYLGIKEFCEEMDQWLINEHFKNPSHNHITPYHAVKELLSSKRVNHVKGIRYTEASYKTTLFYFYTELFIRLDALFCFCYYNTCSWSRKRKEGSLFL